MSEKRKLNPFNVFIGKEAKPDRLEKRQKSDHRPTSLNIAKHLYGKNGTDKSSSSLGKRKNGEIDAMHEN